MKVQTKSTKTKSPNKATKQQGKKVTTKPVKKVAQKPVKKVATKPVKKAAQKPVKKVAQKPVKKVATKPVKKVATKPGRKAGARSALPARATDPTSEAALRSLSADYEAGPDMPVKVAQLEYASLARLALTAAAPLAKVGITRLHITTLGNFAKRLGTRELAWQKARAGVSLATAERKQVAEAEALKAQLLAGGRWACRKDDAALAELVRIADGSGLSDTIQDLRELVGFWEAHGAERRHTDITPQQLPRAVELAAKLDLAAEKETNNLDAAAALALRNRCFWAADELAREIREGGRYAFRQQPKTAARFVSRYRSTILRRSRSKPKDEQAPAPAPTA